ncbi:MAG TPA: hypothetical protein VE685_19280 [Thermoanaerobaculia bacterium]|nr:hypothetical protein [Thermoanaerobaculia bacterium]
MGDDHVPNESHFSGKTLPHLLIEKLVTELADQRGEVLRRLFGGDQDRDNLRRFAIPDNEDVAPVSELVAGAEDRIDFVDGGVHLQGNGAIVSYGNRPNNAFSDTRHSLITCEADDYLTGCLWVHFPHDENFLIHLQREGVRIC